MTSSRLLVSNRNTVAYHDVGSAGEPVRWIDHFDHSGALHAATGRAAWLRNEVADHATPPA